MEPVVERSLVIGVVQHGVRQAVVAARVVGLDKRVLGPVPKHQRGETTTKGAMRQTAATGLMVRRYRYIATEPYIPAVHPTKRSQRLRLNA